MAASLNQRGYPLVTDDVCAIDVSGTPLVHPDGRLLKLWSQAIEALELGGRQGAHVRASLSKHFVEPTGVSNEPLEIGAIYVLTEANPTCERGIRRASLVECGTLLHRNAYRPTLIARLGQEALYFRGVAQIAASGCIFRLVRRQDFAELPGVVTELERHWKDTGLVASD
ncbi:MAG: hypothetical protein P4L57_02915 [Rhizomicrobium sp.]|nr:hypothetical protein [Rhizomicrobium sp.]